MTLHRFGNVSAGAPLLALVLVLRASSLAAGQEPPGGPPDGVTPYRAPAIALVQPENGGPVPDDKPVILFRFATGEPGDPLDVSSFRVWVDGVDRSARFTVTATEAWGPIRRVWSSGSRAGPRGRSSGAHQVLARVCSSRGACAEARATVTVVQSAVVAREQRPRRTGWGRVLDVLLWVIRKLVGR